MINLKRLAEVLVIGVAEALVYYNMGSQQEGEDFQYKVPPAKELATTAGVVLVTSVLTALLTNGLEKLLELKPGAVGASNLAAT